MFTYIWVLCNRIKWIYIWHRNSTPPSTCR